MSPDGSQVFVTGTGIGASGTLDYITLAYGASTGATQWSKRYVGAAGRADVAFALDVSPDGSIVAVTGYESDASGVTTTRPSRTTLHRASGCGAPATQGRVTATTCRTPSA